MAVACTESVEPVDIVVVAVVEPDTVAVAVDSADNSADTVEAAPAVAGTDPVVELMAVHSADRNFCFQ